MAYFANLCYAIGMFMGVFSSDFQSRRTLFWRVSTIGDTAAWRWRWEFSASRRAKFLAIRSVKNGLGELFDQSGSCQNGNTNAAVWAG
jgi:hypothetical protein